MREKSHGDGPRERRECFYYPYLKGSRMSGEQWIGQKCMFLNL